MLARVSVGSASRQVLSIVLFAGTVVAAYLAGFCHGADETFAQFACQGRQAQIVRESNDPIRRLINRALENEHRLTRRF